MFPDVAVEFPGCIFWRLSDILFWRGLDVIGLGGASRGFKLSDIRPSCFVFCTFYFLTYLSSSSFDLDSV
jgi:hypothetical protein